MQYQMHFRYTTNILSRDPHLFVWFREKIYYCEIKIFDTIVNMYGTNRSQQMKDDLRPLSPLSQVGYHYIALEFSDFITY